MIQPIWPVPLDTLGQFWNRLKPPTSHSARLPASMLVLPQTRGIHMSIHEQPMKWLDERTRLGLKISWDIQISGKQLHNPHSMSIGQCKDKCICNWCPSFPSRKSTWLYLRFLFMFICHWSNTPSNYQRSICLFFSASATRKYLVSPFCDTLFEA